MGGVDDLGLNPRMRAGEIAVDLVEDVVRHHGAPAQFHQDAQAAVVGDVVVTEHRCAVVDIYAHRVPEHGVVFHRGCRIQ